MYKLRKTLVAIIAVTCFMLSSCIKPYKQQTTQIQLSTVQNTGVEYKNQATQKQESAGTIEDWKLVDTKSYDINNDKKENTIALYWLNDSNSVPKIKIKIDDKEKVFKFDPTKTIGVTSVNLKQFVNLHNSNMGLLIQLNSEGEAEPFDNNFLVVGQRNNDITVILDGVNQPYNLQDNYIVKYIGEYNIEFSDKATGFNAKYAATIYKSMDDGEERLKSVNNRQTSWISNNYNNIKVQDINSDGVDEIVCSKFIPGLYHADTLGVIDYTFTFENDKYSIFSESLTYDSEVGPFVIKELKIK
jgi:hypothetical protein